MSSHKPDPKDLDLGTRILTAAEEAAELLNENLRLTLELLENLQALMEIDIPGMLILSPHVLRQLALLFKTVQEQPSLVADKIDQFTAVYETALQAAARRISHAGSSGDAVLPRAISRLFTARLTRLFTETARSDHPISVIGSVPMTGTLGLSVRRLLTYLYSYRRHIAHDFPLAPEVVPHRAELASLTGQMGVDSADSASTLRWMRFVTAILYTDLIGTEQWRGYLDEPERLGIDPALCEFLAIALHPSRDESRSLLDSARLYYSEHAGPDWETRVEYSHNGERFNLFQAIMQLARYRGGIMETGVDDTLPTDPGPLYYMIVWLVERLSIVWGHNFTLEQVYPDGMDNPVLSLGEELRLQNDTCWENFVRGLAKWWVLTPDELTNYI